MGRLLGVTERTNAHSSDIYSVAFSPDGSRIATVGWDNVLRVWDPWMAAKLATIWQSQWAFGDAVSIDEAIQPFYESSWR